jgi:hypothetical protein
LEHLIGLPWLFDDFKDGSLFLLGGGGCQDQANRLGIAALFADDLAQILLGNLKFHHGRLIALDFADCNVVWTVYQCPGDKIHQLFQFSLFSLRQCKPISASTIARSLWQAKRKFLSLYASIKKIERIIFSTDFFAATNPSHRADIGKTLARLLAAIVFPSVIRGKRLRKIHFGVFDGVIIRHGAPPDPWAGHFRYGPAHLVELKK